MMVVRSNKSRTLRLQIGRPVDRFQCRARGPEAIFALLFI
jgi:hypothetical protein